MLADQNPEDVQEDKVTNHIVGELIENYSNKGGIRYGII